MKLLVYTVQKIKFSIKDFFSKCDQIRSLTKCDQMENLIFYTVLCTAQCISQYINPLTTNVLHHTETSQLICYSEIGPKKVFNEEIPQEEQQPGPSRQCNNLAESLNDESSNEDADTTCKIFRIPWIELTEKCGDWVQCLYAINISAQSAMKREIFPQMMIFFCSMCIGFFRFPFNCALRCLIMQLIYQLLLSHS